jgi:hypothetical protein
LASADTTNVAAKLSIVPRVTPYVAKNIFYLGDSYLDDGNFQALAGIGPAYYSNGPPGEQTRISRLGYGLLVDGPPPVVLLTH